MPNSYRIRTQLGVDKSVRVLLKQDFEQLEILSLKILQNQIYTRQCSDYGVIIGRISVNDGFGLPNCKVSVFIPLTAEDERNPVISELYPYRTVATTNEDGFRYNLLPYVQSHSGHVPTGSFPDREDVLTNPSLIEVYDKYYKYTVQTNESGDYMIFGVPVGGHILHVDIDLSDIGEFSLSPQDLIRMGLANETQVAGVNFKSSTNLNSLPQIVSFNKSVNVEPFWGEPEICTIGITRTDFDITQEANISITPNAIFMGSIFSSNDKDFQKANCKPKIKQGELCNLVAGPGEILAIRQTINLDAQGRPVLEVFDLDAGGQVIDDNGTWLLDVPMNLDYVITNEFGERVLSNDPKVGIPTKGKYRFKIKWNQSPKLSEPIKRAYFLVPNIREYGWTSNGNIDPFNPNTNPTQSNTNLATKSYAFSLDWNDYVDINAAINCEDTFYLMSYNKVYSVSQLIDQYRKGFLPNRIIAIRNILDDVCESDNVRFPTNDAVYRFDLLYLLFVISVWIFLPIIYILLVVAHLLAWIMKGLGIREWRKIANMQLPNLSYPDCDLCDCEVGGENRYRGATQAEIDQSIYISENAFLSPLNQFIKYNCSSDTRLLELISGNDEQNCNPSLYLPSNYYCLGQYQAPQLLDYTQSGNIARNVFTNSIPVHERINLFNSKAKYFDSIGTTNNPGGGWNRMLVRFRPTLNGFGVGGSNVQNQYANDYLNVEVTTGTIPFSTNVNPVNFNTFNQQPTIGPNPFNLLTDRYVVPISGTYTIELNANTQNLPNRFVYNFFIRKNNQNIGSVTLRNGLRTTLITQTFQANDFINIVGNTTSTSPYNFDCNVTLKITGVPLDNKHHMDNCMVMLVKPENADNLTAGKIFSFQDPLLSSDPNITGGTLNQYGTNGIIGTSINNTGTIDVYWADHTGQGNDNKTIYTISQVDTDAQYSKYAMDVEYFQVITAMTVSRYLQLCESNPSSSSSFLNRRAGSLQYRVILNDIMIHKVRIGGHCWDLPTSNPGPQIFNSFECFNDWENQIIVFMNRGVDPYSSRGEVEYDLSVLFSYLPDSNGRPTGQVKVRGTNYKLNIPIQGHYGCVRHDQLDSAFTPGISPNLDVTGIDTIMQNISNNPITFQNANGSSRLYFPSYHFEPAVSEFTGFTSTLPSYYLSSSGQYAINNSLHSNFISSIPGSPVVTFTPQVSDSCDSGAYLAGAPMEPNYRYLKLIQNTQGSIFGSNGQFYDNFRNGFITQFDRLLTGGPNSGDCERYGHTDNVINNINLNRGYYPNEIIDGSSFMHQIIGLGSNNTGLGVGITLEASGFLYSPAYLIQSYNFNNCASTKRIVMRSDRLPTSTSVVSRTLTGSPASQSFALHQNNLFSLYEISDDGSFELVDGSPVGTPQFSSSAQTQEEQISGLSITSTFSCKGMVPLNCYYNPINTNELNVRPSNDSCYTNGVDRQLVMKNGCYILITAPFDSLGKDFVLLTEWVRRLSLTFAACRNIFSHVFTNNWINGSLYAFSFSNQRIFDSVNQPTSDYCKDTIYLHPTNNFYYRSSPFFTGTSSSNPVKKFVGSKAPTGIFGLDYKGNIRNLKFPTTMIDLGPRNVYLQELIYSDEFDGYMVNRLSDTSYQDVSDLLNLVFLNRLTNLNIYLDLVTSFFNDRERSINFIDGDYAQMISINSELGVVELETSNYLPIDNKQDPIYFCNPNSTDPIFGVFFSSDSQTRDYVTPKRTIINPNIPPTYSCAFSNFTVFSQLVPFYQWEIKPNKDTRYTQTIFGSQRNEWYTNTISGGTFFAKKYQDMDRTSQDSRYFKSTSPLSIDYKGYIYSYDRTITSPTFDEYDIRETSWSKNLGTNNSPVNYITVGAPFHFYFGLKKGKTSWDRFVRKWINTSNITE